MDLFINFYYAQVNLAQEYHELKKEFLVPVRYYIDKDGYYLDKGIIAIAITEKKCVKRMKKYLRKHPIRNYRYLSGTGFNIMGDLFEGDRIEKCRSGFVAVHNYTIRD